MIATYLHRRYTSFRCAFAGIHNLLASQPHARLHLLASLAVIAAGAYLRLPPHDWCWLIAAMAMVWVAEALNTALEHLADAACPQYHPLIRRAKDTAAAAVLLAALAATAIATCILL